MEPEVVLPLLGDGDAPRRAGWDAAAAAVLRKAGRLGADDPDVAAGPQLDRALPDGVVVPALGTAEDVRDLPRVGAPGAEPYTRGNHLGRAAGWDVRAHLAEPDREHAAASAQTDLKNGATSLWIVVGETGTALSDLDAMLADVYVSIAPLVVEADITVDPLDVARALATVLDDRDTETVAPATNLGVDPIGRLARYGRPGPGREPDEVARVVAVAAELAVARSIRGLVVDATVVHDAGGTVAQELGYALATGVTYLRALESSGYAPDAAAGLVEFRFAATDEQFPTIAKLRAARTLWHRVTELAGFPVRHRIQRQHVVTSRPMVTRYDPWVNMLRTTVAAFAAGIAGAESVTVLPFDHALGRPDTLARRIARNTSSLLVQESHVARAADPAGGAYAVEMLTDRVAQAGWAEFQRLEAAGGVEAALRSGDLADRVAAAWAERRSGVAHRALPITGVTEFPLAGEALPDRVPWPVASAALGEGALEAISYAADFEALRDDPVTAPVFVGTLGPVARHTTRASFVANLLTSGGVPSAIAGATSTAADVVDRYRESPSPVVLIAGADSDYATLAPAVITQLRAEGARWIALAGSPSDTLAATVDATISAEDDAIAFLGEIRSRLQEVTR